MPSETETSQKCESSRHFKPLDEYSEDGNGRIFEYSNGLRVESKVLSGVIMTDYFFRMVVQLSENCEKKQQALREKEAEEKGCTQVDSDSLQDCEDMIEEIKTIIPILESAKEHTETSLPQGPLKRSYGKIRKNAAWYLRKELVKDCVKRGGCCARSCGCCKRRARAGKNAKGIGHCTAFCVCCEASREAEVTTDEKGTRVKDKVDPMGEMDVIQNLLESEDPAHLLTLAEAYFCTPGLFGLGKISFIKTVAWNWKKSSLRKWESVSKLIREGTGREHTEETMWMRELWKEEAGYDDEG